MFRQLALASFALAVAAFAPQVRADTPAPGREAGPDRVVVQFASASTQAQTADGAAPSLADQGFRTLTVPPGKTRDQFIAELSRSADVVSVAADASAYAAAVPNDPFYGQNQAAYLAAINAPAGWDVATGSRPVVIAVLDSGLDATHEEYQGRLWENQGDLTLDGIDDDNNGCIDDRNGCRIVDLTPTRANACGYTSSRRTGAIQDDHGSRGSLRHSHGTLVTGIAGATGNNGKGIAGLAWNVRIMPVKVLDCGPFGSSPRADISAIAEGIDYARRMGANIINISISSDPGDQTADAPVLRRAMADAERAGIIVVAAAGNHAPNASQVGPGYPGAYTQYANLVTVGASDVNGRWATFSNYGPALDFAAPGIAIASTVRTDIGFNQPYGADGEGGTSFSTPLVSGLFALMLSRNTELGFGDAIAIARATATAAAEAPHGQNWAGSGVINVGRALEAVPMLASGAALRDWKDVPAGTEVRATIDGIECGSTTAEAFGPVSRFTLRVRPAAEINGCGAPGKTVQFLVGGAPAVPLATWGGKDVNLATGLDVSVVTPPPGPIVVQSLNGKWSNIAHLDPTGAMPNALTNLSSPWTQVLRWQAAKPFLEGEGAFDRYHKGVPTYVNDIVELDRYDAVWIDGAAANFATQNPNPPAGRVVQLRPGWNNFTWTGSNRAVSDALGELDGKYSQVLQFDNATSAWLSYLPGRLRYLNDFGGLFKFKVYWVFMTEAAQLRMD